jgi:hypothetical protein
VKWRQIEGSQSPEIRFAQISTVEQDKRVDNSINRTYDRRPKMKRTSQTLIARKAPKTIKALLLMMMMRTMRKA